MVFGVLIEFGLDKASEMRTKHASFMCRVSRTMISDSWIFSQRYTDGYYLGIKDQHHLLVKSGQSRIHLPSAPDYPCAF